MERSNLFVLSIVAVVAVAGLAMVFLQSSTPADGVFVDEQGNVVGEAVRALGGACPSCKNLVWVGEAEMGKKFAEGAEVRGADACRALGYSGCFAAQIKRQVIAFASTDGTCRDQQAEFIDTSLDPCTSVGTLRGVERCDTWTSGAEPKQGDLSSVQNIVSVICMR